MDFQELTALGQHQCEKVGEILRTRYLDPVSPNHIRDINSSYRGFDYVFHSSDTNRTMRTCYAIGMGLFPIGSGRRIDTMPGNCGLPECSQSIPIRTIEKADNDPILRGYENCDIYQNEYLPNALKNDKELHEKYERYGEEINEILGFKGKDFIPLEHWDMMFDLVNCQKQHDLLNVTGFGDEQFRIVSEINDYFRVIQFRRKIVSNILGGNFVRLVLSSMDKFVKNFTTFRYHQFCAHDMTLLSVASALGFTEDYGDFRKQPGYGATLSFELHKENDEYLVKVLFLHSYKETEFKTFTLGPSASSCNNGNGMCEYSKFSKIANSKCSATVKDYCDYCKSFEREICLRFELEEKANIIKSKEQLILIGWVLMSVFAFMSGILCIVLCCSCILSVSGISGTGLVVLFRSKKSGNSLSINAGDDDDTKMFIGERD